jgi:dihydropteroate synthase
MFWNQTTINCRGTLLDLSDPIVMAILNLTPDSFFDGGNYNNMDAIKFRVESIIKEGATILDIGGMSSRPGAEIISPSEESERILPAIQWIRNQYPELILSVDTVHAAVARTALDEGIHIINDISAGEIDAEMLEVITTYQVPYILMHMKGTPGNMQKNPVYEHVLNDVLDFLIQKLGLLVEQGILDVLVDPGFGFGKQVSDNFALLQHLHIFRILERPIVVGLSRKSFITKSLHIPKDQALNGTTALHMIALQQGAKVLRVHDVKEAKQCIELWKNLSATEHKLKPF